ncbi:MAG: DUF2127 domain-containing protein [Verrucomicrobiia bacterium]
MSADPNSPSHRQHVALRIIAVFKLVKAMLMMLVALGARALVSHDLSRWAHGMTGELQMQMHSHYVQLLLAKLGAMQPHSLEAISAVAFGFAVLLATEGVGLWLEKRWAEYLTIAITTALVPIELYEICLHATAMKLVVLCANAAVVGYLVAVLRRERRS